MQQIVLTMEITKSDITYGGIIMRRILCLTAALLMLISVVSIAQDDARLLRFPAIHDDQVVFTYAGDLYTVSASGGIARRLTSHIGYEMFARFSPDGKQIAFTGQYDGNTEVYLVPAEGGIPKRLTYTATLGRDDVSDRMGPNNIVMGWKNDSEIVFRSRMREHNSFNGQLYTVTTGGGMPDQVPVPRGGFTSFSADGNKMAYNRIFREFRTWKRYRGGMADDVWILDFNSKELSNITDNPAQDIIPMWHGDKIYFLSDRDENKKMNLYVYDIPAGTTTQLTRFRDFDIKFPSIGQNAIVFENGGYIYRFDLAGGRSEQIHIRILDDLTTARGGITKVKDFIGNYEIAPDGKRALFGARGEIFTIPAEHGNTRNLTNTSGVHERNSKWSPDGKWIAYISDESGENELYVMKPDGTEKKRLTKNADTYYYQMYWSPDSKKLLWADKMMRLRFVDVESAKVTEVDDSKVWEFNDYAWSPDSKWITYARPEEETMSKVYIYSVEDKKRHEVTDGWFDSGSPIFSQDGKYLFFVSNRDFNPIYSQTEWNHAYADMGRIYLVTLAKDTESPFKPKSDEVKIKEDEPKKEEQQEKKEEPAAEEKLKDIKVDADGLKDRIAGLPVQPGNYRSLVSVGSKLYYLTANRRNPLPVMKMYDLSDLKETELGQINGYEVSADQKKMLVSQGGDYAIICLPSGKIDIKKKLDLSNMEMRLDRHAEWVQIFDESWRQMRDFFYAPNMHGLDWKAVHDKYRPLVDHVNHRRDLTYIIGEMIGELSAGHTYVGGGDYPQADRIRTGLLGAELEKDSQSGYFRIAKILRGQNWDNSLRSPLTEIGVSANEGDYILAVNGTPTNDMPNIFATMVNTVGKQVTLTINSRPDTNGSRDVVVRPIADEAQLYYFNWVQNNIRKVSEATDGKVGYVHIPDMGVPGLNEFVKYFYPQLRKKALIIDVRGNGGGNVSPMIIERLRREVAMVDMARNVRVPGTDPGEMLLGPKVALVDEFSASDGDIFPYRFKKYEMGTLIGKRSWGGVVGIRGSLPFTDGGVLNKPEFAPYDPDGTGWVIEGYGVDPDIYVDNDPTKEFEGIDEQLDKAIEVIAEQLAQFEKTLPPIPKFPIKR